MFDDIKQIVLGCGLFKAIEQVELEISTGKLIEKKVNTSVIEKTESDNSELSAIDQKTQFKNGRQAIFTSYEDYTEEEQFKLVEKAIIHGITDSVTIVKTLRCFCEKFNVTIQFDDGELIEAREVDESFLAFEKKILAAVKRYE